MLLKIDLIKTNKNYMISFSKTSQNWLKMSHSKDFYSLPCSLTKLA